MNLRTYLRIKTANMKKKAGNPNWAGQAEADAINRYNYMKGYSSYIPKVELRSDPVQELKRNLSAIKGIKALTDSDPKARDAGLMGYDEWHDKYGYEPKSWRDLSPLEEMYPGGKGIPSELKDKYDRLLDDTMYDSDVGDYTDYVEGNK